MYLVILLLLNVTQGLTWSSNVDLSVVVPKDEYDEYYLLRATDTGSIKLDSLAQGSITLETLDNEDGITDPVIAAALVGDAVYMLTDQHELLVWHTSTTKVSSVTVPSKWAELGLDNTSLSLQMMAYPQNITKLSNNHQFVVILDTTDTAQLDSYVAYVSPVNGSESEMNVTEVTLNNTFDLSATGFDQTNLAISLTLDSVNLILAGGQESGGAVSLGMYSTKQLNTGSFENASLAGVYDENDDSIYGLATSGSSAIHLTVSQGLTGGLFLYSTRELMYSLFDGAYPEYVVDKTTQTTFAPSSDIRMVLSGYDGDFLVVTESKLFYGKEAFKKTLVIELDLDSLITSGFVLSSTAHVGLVSLSYITIWQDSTDYIIDLNDFFDAERASNPCPVYGIDIGAEKFIEMDNIEQLETSSIIHGFDGARAIVATPVPETMKLNITNIKWKERSNVDSREVKSTLTVDEDVVRSSMNQRSWIVPQNTWYYEDSPLSCSQRTYDTVSLHYGQCPLIRIEDLDAYLENGAGTCDGWLSKKESYLLELPAGVPDITPRAFMQLTYYHAELATGDTSENTGLKLVTIEPNHYGRFQKFTREEELRALFSCNETQLTVAKCSERLDDYGLVNVASKVGKPFIPNFDLIFSHIDEDECPAVKSSRTISSRYTIVIQAEFGEETFERDTIKELNDFSSTSAYQYTFDAKMAKCATKPQNYYQFMDSDVQNLNDLWSRENFVDCAGTADEDHDFSEYENEPYPILGNHYTVLRSDYNVSRVRKRIREQLKRLDNTWDDDIKFELEDPNDPREDDPNNLREHCYKGECENRIIFTKPGSYIATAILLDPVVTSCNLRFSFIIKVTELDSILDQELLMVSILTSGSLVLLTIVYFLQPIVYHYFRKSVSSIARKSGLRKQSERRNARSVGMSRD